jgi:histidinol-phosphate/aromatic aminotransferase/cobyric acid decarboxylase-like protein
MHMTELIDAHDDGVLFIDEAYGLVKGKGDVSVSHIVAHRSICVVSMSKSVAICRIFSSIFSMRFSSGDSI